MRSAAVPRSSAFSHGSGKLVAEMQSVPGGFFSIRNPTPGNASLSRVRTWTAPDYCECRSRPTSSILPLLAVISDVHANLEALTAVLDEIDRAGAEVVYCLGDLVGYGADPKACLDLIRERCTLIVAGNHDLAVASEQGLASLPRDGRTAAERHRTMLPPSDLDWLAALPLRIDADACTLVHASPQDPERWYRLDSAVRASDQFAHFATDVCFIGHTHVPGMMSDRLGVFNMRRGRRYLVNVGSVGQPRDQDPRASFVFFDPEAFSCEFVRVPYDVERAAGKIVEAGLPEGLGRRLRVGV